jgi:hypothetical protein
MRFNITSRRPNEWVFVFFASRQPKQVQLWRFFAVLAGMTPPLRRATDPAVRTLEARGLLDVRSRYFAPWKAGAT